MDLDRLRRQYAAIDWEDRGDLADLLASDIRADNARLSNELERTRAALAAALPVLAYVSRGRSYVGVEPYPDATARFALGAIDDAGRVVAAAPHTVWDHYGPCDYCERLTAELVAARAEADKLRAELTQLRREHLVDVPYRHMGNLRAWLERPNGSHTIGRLTLDAVESGGILVRTQPYTAPAAAPQPDRTCVCTVDISTKPPFIVDREADCPQHGWTVPAAAPQPDDLDTHLAQQMADPAFAAAYRAREARAGDGEQDTA